MNNSNKDIYLTMLEQDPNGWNFRNYLEKNKITLNDKEIVKAALEKNGQILRFCSDKLRDDYDLVKIAVSNNGMALDYASKNLKDNDDIVKIAMKLNQAILFASDRIKKSKDFALISLRYNPGDIRFYCNDIKNICGDGKLQKNRLLKAIESEKLANSLTNQLPEKNELKLKVKI